QTAGELRARSSRLCHFEDVHETEAVVVGLTERRDGPFAARLARDAGSREPRYVHLFGGEDAKLAASAAPDVSAVEVGRKKGGLEQLEELVLEMQEQMDDIKARLERLEQ
ncbi:MAG: DUF480 domain-containing protein, partial [Sedimenticolaceae bacterium]